MLVYQRVFISHYFHKVLWKYVSQCLSFGQNGLFKSIGVDLASYICRIWDLARCVVSGIGTSRVYHHTNSLL